MDTLKYINDALSTDGADAPYSDGVSTENRVLKLLGEKLVFAYHESDLKNGAVAKPVRQVREIYPVYSLDCKADGFINGARYTILASCSSKEDCGTSISNYDNDGGSEQFSIGGFSMSFAVDRDHGERLARALSHLVAMLQQEYKRSHSDQNDPFAKSH